MHKRNFLQGAISEIGKAKTVNQDSILIEIGEDRCGEFGLFVVADGMGGHHRGEYASRLCITMLRTWWHHVLPGLASKRPAEQNMEQIMMSLKKVVFKANTCIYEYGLSMGEIVGTTLTILFIKNSSYNVCHIGDCRIYKLSRPNPVSHATSDEKRYIMQIEQLTQDHTWVSEQISKGILSLDAAAVHPAKHVLTQGIGIGENVTLFEIGGKVMKEDIFLICSDGFYNRLIENEIAHTISRYVHMGLYPQIALKQLLNLIYKREETDDISAILIQQEYESGWNIVKKLKKNQRLYPSND